MSSYCQSLCTIYAIWCDDQSFWSTTEEPPQETFRFYATNVMPANFHTILPKPNRTLNGRPQSLKPDLFVPTNRSHAKSHSQRDDSLLDQNNLILVCDRFCNSLNKSFWVILTFSLKPESVCLTYLLEKIIHNYIIILVLWTLVPRK